MELGHLCECLHNFIINTVPEIWQTEENIGCLEQFVLLYSRGMPPNALATYTYNYHLINGSCLMIYFYAIDLLFLTITLYIIIKNYPCIVSISVLLLNLLCVLCVFLMIFKILIKWGIPFIGGLGDTEATQFDQYINYFSLLRNTNIWSIKILLIILILISIIIYRVFRKHLIDFLKNSCKHQ